VSLHRRVARLERRHPAPVRIVAVADLADPVPLEAVARPGETLMIVAIGVRRGAHREEHPPCPRSGPSYPPRRGPASGWRPGTWTRRAGAAPRATAGATR
jgi:hypothetical protein